MEGMRKPYQGVLNVIRFNWPYYVLSVIFILTASVIAFRLQQEHRRVAFAFVLVVILVNIISLFVSWFIYDHSSLYRLSWLDRVQIERHGNIININAGFDETSVLLKNKRSEEHTSELQSHVNLVCRLLLEK